MKLNCKVYNFDWMGKVQLFYYDATFFFGLLLFITEIFQNVCKRIPSHYTEAWKSKEVSVRPSDMFDFSFVFLRLSLRMHFDPFLITSERHALEKKMFEYFQTQRSFFLWKMSIFYPELALYLPWNALPKY